MIFSVNCFFERIHRAQFITMRYIDKYGPGLL